MLELHDMNLFSDACDHSNTPRGSVGGRTPIQSRVILDSPVPVIAFTCRGMYVRNFAKTKTDLGNLEVFETIHVKDSFHLAVWIPVCNCSQTEGRTSFFRCRFKKEFSCQKNQAPVLRSGFGGVLPVRYF